ncbi:MAG: CPBP family intramembrane glutamic endopeptidase [Paludibacter sp.]
MIKFKGILENNGIFSNLLLIVGTASFFALFGVLLWTTTGGNANDIDSIKLLQLIQSLGMFVIPPFFLAYFWSKKPLVYLHLDKKLNRTNAGLLILFMLLIIPFINLLGEINQQLVLPNAFAGIEAWMKAAQEQSDLITGKLLDVHNLGGLSLNILLIAMVPALGEELFFRAALQGVIQKWKGATIAIWISAFIFSAIHLQFYGFVPRLLLGAFFGYMLVWSGNLWLPILAHFVNNATAVIFYYFKNNGYNLPDIDKLGTGNTLWIGILSGFVAIAGIIWFKKRMQKVNLP